VVDRSVRRALIAGAALLVVTAVATSAFAGAWGVPRAGGQGPRIPVALPAVYRQTVSVDPLVPKQLRRHGSVDVLVTLDGASTLSAAKAAAQGNSRALLRRTEPAYRAMKVGLHLRVPGLRVLQDYDALPVQFVRVRSRTQLARLEADPSVTGVGANREDTLDLTQSLPLIGQPQVQSAGFTGAGTAVAVLDSGVDYTRSAFGSCSAPGAAGCKVVVAQDFAPNDGQLDDPAAGFHGTNVSGIVVGVAPDTKVLGLDVFNGLSSNTATQVNAINFAISQQATYNIRAINMSLGAAESYNTSPCGDPADARVAAFASARAAGILPVVAAGNSRFANGSNHVGISRPACIPGALPVGAVYDGNVGSRTWGGPSADDTCTDSTTAADTITCFSQVWSDPMILAPGAVITSAGITQAGTSQATPHVAGAVAVLYGAAGSPSLTSVENALRNQGPSIFDPLVGQSFHRLFLPDAIAGLDVTTPPPTTSTPPPTPPPPTCTITGTSASERLVGTSGDDVICGGGGNDVLVPNGGTDMVIGGAGFDLVSLEAASGGGTIDLNAGTATAPGLTVTLQQIEGGIGTPFNDTLLGNGADNDFLGIGGDDSIDGGGGFDFIRFDFATVRIKADLGAGTVTGEGLDTIAKVEGFLGGPKSDRARGNGKTNTLQGAGGSDRLSGLGKPDLLLGGPGTDALFGGGGYDALIGGSGGDFCDLGPGGGSTSSC
jgi:subtilase family protein/hemolysin type calcium-binding protein